MEGAATHPTQLKPHHSQISPLHHPHHQRRGRGRGRAHFHKGSLVEVRTNEEDFVGVYFSATVIHYKFFRTKGSQKKPKKLFVEYHNLLVDEDRLERLREYVDVSCVRPAPPFLEIVEGFKPNDVVDAFHKDGWWTGVVSQVVESGERFVVTFQYPPDELEFGLAELRVHWDWANGIWVRPENSSIAGLMFDVGRKVEVSFDREDGQDAWFPAIIKENTGNGSFLVEYNRANSHDKAQACKVTIDSLHVRPCPPLLKDKKFNLLEKVDAFFDSGWWSGVITKELENCRYVVFFRQMKKDMEFNQSDLRPHMEWKDSKWFTSSQLSQEVSIPSSDEGMHEHHIPENSSASEPTVPVNNSGYRKDTCVGDTPSLTPKKGHLEQLTPDSQNKSHATSSLTKRKQNLSYSRNTRSQPLKKLKEGNVRGANKKDTHDRSTKSTLLAAVSPVSVNNIEISAKQTATGDQPSDNPSWGKRNPRKQRNVDATRNVGEKINYTSSNISTQMLQVRIPELDIDEKMPDAVGNTSEDVKSKHKKEEAKLPVIIGLPCSEKGSSGYGKLRVRSSHHCNSKAIINISDKKPQLNDSTTQKIEDGKQLAIGESSEKRKRGRPRKIPIASTQTPVTDDLNKNNEDAHKIPEVGMIDMDAPLPIQEKMAIDQVKQNNSQSNLKNRKGSMTKRTSAKLHEVEVNESPMLPENRSSKIGRRQISSGKIARHVQDSHGASGGKVTEGNPTMEVEKVVCEAPSNDFDDEPLSKWIEGRHSPNTIDGSRPSPVSTVEQCVENGEKQRDDAMLEENSEKQPESGMQTSEKQPENEMQTSEKQPESGMQTSALVDKGSIVPIEQQSLPFVKNTVLWKTIESMEAFQRIPQRPHFQPLEHFKESSREGLAIGYMVTFSSVVEKTSKLQFNELKSIKDDILETLVDLEIHGFDVRVVRDRVNELLAVKDKEEKLVDEVNELNHRILEHNHEKNRIEEEIREINEQILKLQEKRLLAESAKGSKDDEIATLEARLKETKESINNVRCDFEGIASSTLRLV